MRQLNAAPTVAPPSMLPVGAYGPVMQVTNDFTYQSYFDSTLLNQAILTQPQNLPIVPSTKKTEQVKGYAIGLHPSSECPIAVDFKVTGGPVIVVKPGEVVWPLGQVREAKQSTHFEGFDWGLPFGWLGGGLANVLIFQAPQSAAYWPGNPEVIFHRARFPIKQPSDLTNGGAFNNAPTNWPRRFPWVNAVRGVSGSTLTYAQKGKPALSITDCDRVQLVLRAGTMVTYPPAAATSVRIIYQSMTDLDMASDGTFGAANPTFEDITFPTWRSLGTSGNLATQNAALWITPSSPSGLGLLRDNGDSGGIVFVDASGTAALSGGFIDVVRYGRL